MKKKACIITLYDDFNYGNKLQNYALYKILERYNLDVTNIKNNKHLNYLEQNIVLGYIKFLLSKLKHFFKKRKNFGIKYYSKRKKAFKLFSENIFTTKNYFNYYHLDKFNNFNYCFVGSDQVWNPNMSLDDLCLLRNFNGKKIAFSASFGVSEISKNVETRIAPHLKNFDFISVRETSGKEICNKFLNAGKNVCVLVDPTMLLTSKEWNEISIKPFFDVPKKYILLSFLGEIEKEILLEINDFAKLNNYTIINLYEKNSKYTSCGPSEFLYMVKNASLVCTDSFHSCVFSIMFHIPFIAFDRNDKLEKMNSRIDTLINKFSLDNRKYNNDKITKKYLNVDYSKVDNILINERKKAFDFLNEIINEKIQ